MKKYAFGVDIGGTTVKMGLFETTGVLLDTWEISTRTVDGGKNILSDIAEAVGNKIVEKCIEKIDKKGVIMFADVFDLAKKESYCNDIIRYSHGHPD